MKVNLVFAKEWTTEAVEKKKTWKYNFDGESNPNWYFMKSYSINSITCNKDDENYKRENENFQWTANVEEKPPSSW